MLFIDAASRCCHVLPDRVEGSEGGSAYCCDLSLVLHCPFGGCTFKTGSCIMIALRTASRRDNLEQNFADIQVNAHHHMLAFAFPTVGLLGSTTEPLPLPLPLPVPLLPFRFSLASSQIKLFELPIPGICPSSLD